jgi:hypothetical protein
MLELARQVAPAEAEDTSWLGQWVPVRVYTAARHHGMPATLVVELRQGREKTPPSSSTSPPYAKRTPSAEQRVAVDAIARLVHGVVAASVAARGEGRANLPAFRVLADHLTGSEDATGVARVAAAEGFRLLPDLYADLAHRQVAAETLAWLAEELAPPAAERAARVREWAPAPLSTQQPSEDVR